jgi:hypothetical protein
VQAVSGWSLKQATKQDHPARLRHMSMLQCSIDSGEGDR